MKINYDDEMGSLQKKKGLYRQDAWYEIMMSYPSLENEYQNKSDYYFYNNITRDGEDEHEMAMAYMMEKYHVKFIEEKAIILDSDDVWEFVIAITVEWDGIE